MKREDKLATSSSHRENNATEKQKMQAKAVGCMSGLFHFLSSYRSTHKFLTFGNKQEKKRKMCNNNSSSKRSSSSSRTISVKQNVVVHRLSCDVPRSPTLPAEIRHRATAATVGPPALVARLMGLEKKEEEEEPPAKQLRPQEKRRQDLLGALEKCDRDLKDLKKLIDVIRTSPDTNKRQSFDDGKMQHQIQIQLKNKPAGEEKPFTQNIFDRITYESLIQRKPATRFDTNSHKYHEQRIERAISSPSSPQESPLKRSNKAMKDSIEEVSRDISWGQKREIGRIGLALQDHIFRDLIEEVVIDFGSFHFISNVNSLPFEACKRRLCF